MIMRIHVNLRIQREDNIVLTDAKTSEGQRSIVNNDRPGRAHRRTDRLALLQRPPRQGVYG